MIDGLLSWLGVTPEEFLEILPIVLVTRILPIVFGCLCILLIFVVIANYNDKRDNEEEEENLSELDKEIAFIRALQGRKR